MEEAAEPLRHILPVLRSRRRALAVEALGSTGGPDAFGRIAPYASDKNRRVRLSALQALRPLTGEGKGRILMRALSDSCPFVRWEAVHYFREARPPDAAGLLASLLKDDVYFVRFEAASALASFPDDPSLPLEAVLRDASTGEKLALMETLGALPAQKAEPYLKKLLNDIDWSVRGHAALAIGASGVETGPALLEERLAREENRFVRDRIEEALARPADPDVTGGEREE
jgi:HEAT repeat protein